MTRITIAGLLMGFIPLGLATSSIQYEPTTLITAIAGEGTDGAVHVLPTSIELPEPTNSVVVDFPVGEPVAEGTDGVLHVFPDNRDEVSDIDLFKGANIVDIEWEITGPDGQKVYKKGTVQEVYQQLKDENPDLVESFYPGGIPDSASRFPDRSESEHLAARDTRRECFGGWKPAPTGWFLRQIPYLRDVKGKPGQGPGPNSCGQVSCDHNAAIWWCNDSAKSRTLDSFGQIADHADNIVRNCVSPGQLTAGEVFIDPATGWRVIAASAVLNPC